MRAGSVRDYTAYKGWWPGSGKQLEPHDWPAAQSAKEKVSRDEEIDIETFTGKRKTIRAISAPVVDNNGNHWRAIVINWDITERKRAEESLRAYAERLKNLHRIDQAILEASDPPEKITQEAILHLRDLLRCQRVSVGMFDFEKKEARVFAASGDVDSVVQTGLVLSEELYGDLGILRQNQLEIIEDSLKRETVPAIIKTLQAEELEQRVQERTAELLAANQELNPFAYAVSHDLRQPLRAMIGFSQALVEDYGATLPGAAHEFLNHIIQAGRRMGELIDGLLRLSRSTRGELQRDVVDLSALAARILGELAAAEPERRVTWTVAPGLTTRGDERMIEVVLANLLGNAWKYTAKTPQPKIEVGTLEYRSNAGMGKGQDSGAAPSQPAPVFFVRDNGVGFDPKHAARLFQPFQRLHREDEFPGIGIGLATVQRIVHRHGGTIRATAAPGQGATFSFSLSASGGRIRNHKEQP
jgi:signal transduction histidine kinase